MSLTDETGRILRHGVTPLVVIAVHQGWLPEAAQADIIEISMVVVSFAVALLLSWREDYKRRRAAALIAAGGPTP